MKKRYSINKIGSAGLMLQREQLFSLITNIIEEANGASIIFVVSALAGVTRLLGELFKAIEYKETEKIEELISRFESVHFEMIERLFQSDDCGVKAEFILLKEEFISYIDEIVIGHQNTHSHAHVLSFGERVSSLIFNEFINSLEINSRLLDAREFIVGSGFDYLNAVPNICCISKRINERIYEFDGVCVIQGYIASDSMGNSMVMGFDSSDLTASLIAFSLLHNNDEDNQSLIMLSFWKNIDGLWLNPESSLDGIYECILLLKFLQYAINNKSPIRRDCIEIFANIPFKERLEIIIRSFLDPTKTGTIIIP